MTAPAPLDSLEIETHAAPNASILWLHGLGAHGSDFIEAIPELDLPASAALRFVFPHAPVIPVTCNGGYPMRAWYDILALDNSGRRIDAAGLFDNRAALRTLIAREQARGIPTRRILLAGFSQGGALAYATALTHPERLGGLIALSTYLPIPERLAPEFAPANADLPLFITHGALDDVVPPALGRAAHDTLADAGYPAHWRLYRKLPHALDHELLRDLGAWIMARLNDA